MFKWGSRASSWQLGAGGEPEGTQIPGGEVAAATQYGGGKRRGKHMLVDRVVAETYKRGGATTMCLQCCQGEVGKGFCIISHIHVSSIFNIF